MNLKSAKSKLANIGLVIGASVFALLLCELGCRIFLNPADYLSIDPTPDKILGAVDELIANERMARSKLFTFMDEAGIRYVDALPALKGSVEHELYTRTALDMHPNKNGYKVIAETVAKNLRDATLTAKHSPGSVQALQH